MFVGSEKVICWCHLVTPARETTDHRPKEGDRQQRIIGTQTEHTEEAQYQEVARRYGHTREGLEQHHALHPHQRQHVGVIGPGSMFAAAKSLVLLRYSETHLPVPLTLSVARYPLTLFRLM